MYRRQTNKTAIQSQQMIAQALRRLMEHQPLRKITVIDICEEAGVGRKTFYRNFDTKEDVIDFQLDQLCGEYGGGVWGEDKEKQLYHHFAFVQDHADYFIALYKNGLQDFMYDKFAVFLPETMPRWSEDPVEQEYRSRYIISGVETIQRVWVERNFQESIDKVVEIAANVCKEWTPM